MDLYELRLVGNELHTGLSLGPNAKTLCDEMPTHRLSEHTYKQADDVLKVPCGMCSPPPVE